MKQLIIILAVAVVPLLCGAAQPPKVVYTTPAAQFKGNFNTYVAKPVVQGTDRAMRRAQRKAEAAYQRGKQIYESNLVQIPKDVNNGVIAPVSRAMKYGTPIPSIVIPEGYSPGVVGNKGEYR